MNMITEAFSQQTGDLLSILGNPFRIRILYEIGHGEACVCHLEQTLQKRQPYISQHLSVLRDMGVLKTRREGRYIFYRISDLAIFDLLEGAAAFQGATPEEMPEISPPGTKMGCECPSCDEESLPIKVKETS
jgi:DNA-binding transcriptional ArsR family regulator